MITDSQRERLKKNWGEKSIAMACSAEVRMFDPLSKWECFIYAINPDDEDEISCIINGFTVEVCDWRLSELNKEFNAYGESPVADKEYRPKQASELFKELSDSYRKGVCY